MLLRPAFSRVFPATAIILLTGARVSGEAVLLDDDFGGMKSGMACT